jgi:hypothetical protein
MTTETPMIVEVDCSTGEQVTRPMTEAEIANMQTMQAENAARVAADEAAAAEKAALKAAALAKLTALGLTEEEAMAIAGA